ncbi:MAG: MarR family transcriptional regulator [Candidatus Omnitrophica bacterium]|nr:MarR family transcriptional regulator [Candidatus Omnitrophota bacterium]
MRSEFNIGIKHPRRPSQTVLNKNIKKEPKLRQYLVLAHQIKKYLSDNPKKTASNVASWLGLSPSRVSQILNLLFLCPGIQEDVLLSEDKKLYSIPEHKMRVITKEKNWNKQRELWISLQSQNANRSY